MREWAEGGKRAGLRGKVLGLRRFGNQAEGRWLSLSSFFFLFFFKTFSQFELLSNINKMKSAQKIIMLQHECTNKFLSLCWIFLKNYLFTKLNAPENG